MSLFKVSKSEKSKALSKHRTFEQASRSRLNIPRPHRYDYKIYMYDSRYRKWIWV